MIGSFFKSRGDSSAVLQAMMQALGLQIEFQSIERGAASASFRDAALLLSKPGASLQRVQGVMKTGERIEGLIVLSPAEISTKKA